LRDLRIEDRGYGWTAELITRCASRGLRILEVETGYRVRSGVSKVSGNLVASLRAACRMNATIVCTWWRERRSKATTLSPEDQPERHKQDDHNAARSRLN
jgi:hypothetical protein